MSLPMERLFEKIGRPPYAVDQVTILRDECRELMHCMIAGQTVDKNVAVEMFDSMDQMTIITHLWGMYRGAQADKQEGNDEVAQNEPHESTSALEALVTETMEYRQVLLDYLGVPQPSKDLCRQCSWTLSKLLRAPKPPRGTPSGMLVAWIAPNTC